MHGPDLIAAVLFVIVFATLVTAIAVGYFS